MNRPPSPPLSLPASFTLRSPRIKRASEIAIDPTRLDRFVDTLSLEINSRYSIEINPDSLTFDLMFDCPLARCCSIVDGQTAP